MEGLARALGVQDPEQGIDESTAQIRREDWGPNRYKEVPPKTFFGLLFDVLQDPMLAMLCAAALISTILGATIPEQREESAWVEGVAIWIAVSVVSLVGAWNDWSKDKKFRELNSEREVFEVTVIRNGEFPRATPLLLSLRPLPGLRSAAPHRHHEGPC